MLGLRRCSTWEGLAVTSTPLEQAEAFGVFVELSIVAGGDEAGRPYATAVATMERARQAEHEELWAHLFVDETFVDVARVLEIERQGSTDAVFIARFRIPDLHLDGLPHHARVRFVSAVSRIVPRGTGENVPQTQSPAAQGDAEFVAALSRRSAPGLRAAR